MSDNKYISLNRLADFLRNLNDRFAKSVHTHTTTDIEDYKEPDLTGFALKSDVPSIVGLATEAFVQDEALLKAEQELTDEELNQVHKNLKLDNYVSKEQVEDLYKRLNSNTVLNFYCIEDVTIVLNGVSTIYPANSNVEIKILDTDVFEIIPTSDNSILALNAFPGALGTYYSWLEGVKQFSNILFDMNAEDMYTKWNQGNQGAYQVQFAQYLNCIFWSDNPYISELSKRTNYTLYYSSQLPLCYSSIPDNTFKSFYLAFNVNSDPNWGNQAYRESFAKANWATQAFSYYGARTIGIFGHDSPGFNIVLPPDCRGLMSAATAIENAGTFDAINVTNFGASSGSWRDAFGWCSSLRNLYIKNLKVNLNVSWSPLNYDSIYFIISEAVNTSKITITVSPYTYNLLSQADLDLATSKNIAIALNTTNYIEDRRLSAITITGDGSKVLSNDGTYKTVPFKTSQLENDSEFVTESRVEEHIAALVNSAPETLDTLGELAEALQSGEDVVDAINSAIAEKADKNDVLTKSAQTLTDNELTQVRKNLKFIGKDVEGQTFTIDGSDVVASANAEIFGDYETNIAVGQWSIAEGSSTIAKGRASHAEGALTQALADGTHTEGYGTQATGYWSHAEGEMTIVSSYASHAEGSYCTMPDGTKRYSTAAGYASHTEGGGCHTTGVASHAEGIGTTANGRCAHVEGLYTIASGKNQHVEGVANIEDAEDKYIHIAGNGTLPTDRSNAHTLDWEGNAWYAGDVYVGSTSGIDKDDGSVRLARVDELPDVTSFVTQEVLDTKADKSEIPSLDGLATEDYVTEYVTEAIKGLGNSSGGGNTNTPSEEVITTEYTYTYNGDTTDESHTWILNYGGVKIFAKMGDVPRGTLNLVGSTIFRTNPSNQWLDRTFTITEEHLTKVLNKASTDIPATQDGLIQIYDIMSSDFSEFTVLCICTKPGWYNVTFDDWYEIINFPETGIYAYDKRTYGGNDYLKTFTFSATVTQTVGGNIGGDSNNGTSISSIPTKYNGNEISIFSRGICIGDSVTEGSFDSDDGGFIAKRFSYPSILKRITGVDIVNAGIAGMTSQTWYEASLNSDGQWGKWVNQEWVWNMNPTNSGSDIISSILSYSGFDFAIIHMGINDLAPIYDGTKEINEVLTNFETYMNNIITKLKTANKGVKIFLATIIPSYAPATNPTYGQLNDKIKEIVEYTDGAYLLDLNRYSELATKEEYNVTHPTALGYQKLANEIASYISYIIGNNLDEFKEVQFIEYVD